jgi:uncharacterized repeat protein (TIGR02543 family)
MKFVPKKNGFYKTALVCVTAGLLGLFLGGCLQPVDDGPVTAQYAIVFDSHGGSALSPITANTGTAIPRPADPERAGYTFIGWYSAETGGIPYAWPYTLTGNVIMHAQWRENTQQPGQYAIVFDSQGGSAVETIRANAGIWISKPADPEREGYTFTGWYSAAAGGSPYDWPRTLNANVTMYAQWTTAHYTITYILNNGTDAVENPATYTMDSPAITLSAPSRTGYTFGGWYDNAGFTGSAVTTIPTGSTGNKTFYAKWTAAHYTITYILNNGTNAMENPASYTTESPAISLAAPSRTGYTFGGWYNNAGFTGNVVTEIPSGSTGNKSFYAHWTTTTYTITYTLNGGTNAVGNPAFYTIESPAISLAAPSRTSYTFGGWYDNAGFTGSVVTTIPTGSIGNKTFYAKWIINSSSQPINLTVNDFTDPAEGVFSDTNFTLTMPDGSKTITIADNVTDISWYVGLAKIAQGNSVTLDLSVLNLNLGPHTLRVTAKYGGKLYSKEMTFTVNE